MNPKELLSRLGLDRPELRAWAMYDWGNSAFITVIITAVYPIYFQTVAASELEPAVATSRFALVTSAALIVVAVLSPILGAIADVAARRKQFLAAALGLGLVSTVLLWFVRDGDWQLGALLFALGNIGVMLSLVFLTVFAILCNWYGLRSFRRILEAN